MKNKKLSQAVVLVTSVVALSGIILATGSDTDPLVTLSYLEESVTPALKAEAEAQAQESALQLESSINQEIAGLKESITQSPTSTQGQFFVVELSKGETLQINQGTQVVLRSGTAKVTASGSPAMMSLTEGGAVDTGHSLSSNHLYLSTQSNSSITASADSVLMVCGGYEKR